MATRRAAVVVALLLLVFLVASATPSEAWWHGGGRVFVGVGFGPWWYPGPYYYPYPAYAYPYYGYAAPPVVISEAAQTYVERAPAPPTPAPEAYWYYCESARQYYPATPSCPEAWVKVPARPQ